MELTIVSPKSPRPIESDIYGQNGEHEDSLDQDTAPKQQFFHVLKQCQSGKFRESCYYARVKYQGDFGDCSKI